MEDRDNPSLEMPNDGATGLETLINLWRRSFWYPMCDSMADTLAPGITTLPLGYQCYAGPSTTGGFLEPAFRTTSEQRLRRSASVVRWVD